MLCTIKTIPTPTVHNTTDIQHFDMGSWVVVVEIWLVDIEDSAVWCMQRRGDNTFIKSKSSSAWLFCTCSWREAEYGSSAAAGGQSLLLLCMLSVMWHRGQSILAAACEILQTLFCLWWQTRTSMVRKQIVPHNRTSRVLTSTMARLYCPWHGRDLSNCQYKNPSRPDLTGDGSGCY